MIERILYKTFALRDELKELASQKPSREVSIALTHIETALLWPHKDAVDALDPDLASIDSTQG